MMKTMWSLKSMVVVTALVASGCGAADGIFDTDGGASDGSTDGLTLFALSTGDSCFDVETVANVTDGCNIAPGSVVGSALLVNYTMATATLTVGTMGSQGAGRIMNNTGTLTRDGEIAKRFVTEEVMHERFVGNNPFVREAELERNGLRGRED